MTLLKAPFYALARLDFYRTAALWPVRKSFFYLFYLSAVTALLMFLAFARTGIPQVDEFADWLETQMPVLTLTETGLTINLDSPYTITHPDFGPIVTFNTTPAEPPAAELEKVYVYVTSARIYMRRGGGASPRVYDLTQVKQSPALPAEGAAPVVVTPERITQFYQSMRFWFQGIFAIVLFFAVVLWKVLAVLFYSWVGLLINMTRKEKLTFSAIFNISALAMTAGFVFHWLMLAVPSALQVPAVSMLGSVITYLYLFLGIKRA